MNKNLIEYHNNVGYLTYIPTNPLGFKNFIFNNTVNTDDIKNNVLSYKNQAYRKDIENRIHLYIEKMLSKKEQIKIALNTFYILFIIAFILRFLMISIRWSFKELKS
jgi:hypothetical protein